MQDTDSVGAKLPAPGSGGGANVRVRSLDDYFAPARARLDDVEAPARAPLDDSEAPARARRNDLDAPARARLDAVDTCLADAVRKQRLHEKEQAGSRRTEASGDSDFGTSDAEAPGRPNSDTETILNIMKRRRLDMNNQQARVRRRLDYDAEALDQPRRGAFAATPPPRRRAAAAADQANATPPPRRRPATDDGVPARVPRAIRDLISHNKEA